MNHHSEHYHKGHIEPFDVIDDWGLDFYLGNVVKYICRAKHKGQEKDDIIKAITYLKCYYEREFEEVEEG